MQGRGKNCAMVLKIGSISEVGLYRSAHCQGTRPDHPAHNADRADMVIEQVRYCCGA
jgi:hypothetical protein